MPSLKNCPVCNSKAFDAFISTSAQMHSSKEQFNFDQCTNCELVFLNPRVPTDQLKNYYTSHYLPYRGSKAWGKYADLVEKSQLKLDLKRAQRISDVYNMNTNSLLLDIGCGKPSFLRVCKDEFNCKTVGIDFSDEGWKDEADGFRDLDLRVAEIQGLNAELRPDVITMWHYLEHDYTPLENLKYLNKIAKPTTKLVIEVPNFDSTSRKKYGSDWAGWHTPRHTSLFSPDNIALLLANSGWKAEQILTYGTMDPHLLYWMSKMEQKGIKWDKNMEEEFWPFVIDMLLFLPKRIREKKSSLGIMTVIASPQ